MRVLMISLDKTLLGADYSGDVLERHREYAKRAGHLDIIVFSKKGFSQKNFGSNLRIYPTNSLSKIFYVWDAYRAGAAPAKRGQPPQLIVAQDPFLTGLVGWFLKKKFKIPLLIHFHGDFWENFYWLKEKRSNRLLLRLSKFLVKRVDGIRAVSSGIRDKLVRGRADKDKIRVIPTPVNIEKFENYDRDKVKNFREEYHQNRKTIIHVGWRDPLAKDYPTLFKAIELVYRGYKNMAFWQAGLENLNLREKIKADENLILTLTGKIEPEEITNYYHASDVCISSSKHESFGKVLVEAMACGLPVVATATIGSKEIVVDGKNGFLTPIGDSAALAKKVLYLLNNPETARQMGENGQKMVKEKFNREKIVQKILNFWQDLIRNK
ncbi:MAG: hypothetical protein A3J64_01075 [Candidatus Portnoybacteria bacterium RIFCSPHIGHO2_12_FULL_38_9]|uniref:Glycosyltransferase subfamily 4-like N-terminal domain-containing protein n=1 Tax=Candidatus Portnoybacteria bacterium RIFCSPHIGHO2_12_FULL_38_9 TaxID=1801997 RepID=A0A1G2FHN3_9BACT|nr:MAG: hypothetical protein A3J64_01075 [Candidatus Portnoybacteria bacterium RIFCSPHIGHO2_12_FULL_38_9]